MKNKERRRVTINDQDYYIVGEESSRSVKATVYDDEQSGTATDNEMVEVKESKKGTFGFRDKPARSLPEIMQDALSQAVESVEHERMQSEEIDSRVEEIKDTYER